VTAFAAQFLRELLAVFLEASPYILFGFAIAACVHVLLPVHTVQRLLGRGRIRSVLLAALLGIPLPLCSCAVVPTALALRKRGASKGATVSFLVSTPETGEEAIALTWGLIDPLMALFRPIAALLTAITAGLAVEAFGDEKPGKTAAAIPSGTPPEPTPPALAAAPEEHAEHDHVFEDVPPVEGEKLSIPRRLRHGFHDAFVELFDETSHWMLAGLVISALISVLLPASMVTRYLSAGPVPLLLMLLIGIPLYVCASASTPIAAALMMKGLSPGAAFVFLLVGPATNIGSIGILARTLGRRVTAITVACIAIMALACGVLLDVLYPVFGMNPRPSIGEVSGLSRWIAWPRSSSSACCSSSRSGVRRRLRNSARIARAIGRLGVFSIVASRRVPCCWVPRGGSRAAASWRSPRGIARSCVASASRSVGCAGKACCACCRRRSSAPTCSRPTPCAGSSWASAAASLPLPQRPRPPTRCPAWTRARSKRRPSMSPATATSSA
jgi:uncharacterized membrane protein YraQ (UPF0718 family)